MYSQRSFVTVYDGSEKKNHTYHHIDITVTSDILRDPDYFPIGALDTIGGISYHIIS